MQGATLTPEITAEEIERLDKAGFRFESGTHFVTGKDGDIERIRKGLAPEPRLRPQSPPGARPEPPDEAAFYGIAGEIVNTLDPHTEADRAAVLFQTLAICGTMFGAGPYMQIGLVKHYARLYIGIVGETSMARKGESLQVAWTIPSLADLTLRKISGIASGEAIIDAVHDDIEKTVKGNVEIIPGIADKRLQVAEPELARLFRTMKRPSDTISSVLRDAFDTNHIMLIAKTQGLKQDATGAHIGVILHGTAPELKREISDVDINNGFLNRFAWVSARRSKLLAVPEPPPAKAVGVLVATLQRRLEDAQGFGQMKLSRAAADLYTDRYAALTTPQPGTLGAVVARAATLVSRFAMIYALLDGCELIGVEHLEAALAAWDYCAASAAYIFGTLTGDAVADRIEEALTYNGPMSKTEISNEVFERHIKATRLNEAVIVLQKLGRIRRHINYKTGGRPGEIWMLS